ncbi:MAG: hypothetical protein Ta2E_09940 [Mycoplasmoidaceae bacterium]|nr:MAG: hypothetical protein Ta2E_09940 [Mycoplasmoidaceae bacterium]
MEHGVVVRWNAKEDIPVHEREKEFIFKELGIEMWKNKLEKTLKDGKMAIKKNIVKEEKSRIKRFNIYINITEKTSLFEVIQELLSFGGKTLWKDKIKV